MTPDPMRDALQRIAGMRWPIDDLAIAQRIAREALAAHPDDQHVRIPRWAAEALADPKMYFAGPSIDALYAEDAILALRAGLAANPTPEEPA